MFCYKVSRFSASIVSFHSTTSSQSRFPTIEKISIYQIQALYSTNPSPINHNQSSLLSSHPTRHPHFFEPPKVSQTSRCVSASPSRKLSQHPARRRPMRRPTNKPTRTAMATKRPHQATRIHSQYTTWGSLVTVVQSGTSPRVKGRMVEGAATATSVMRMSNRRDKR